MHSISAEKPSNTLREWHLRHSGSDRRAETAKYVLHWTDENREYEEEK